MTKRFLLCVFCLCLAVCMSACTISLGSGQSSGSLGEGNNNSTVQTSEDILPSSGAAVSNNTVTSGGAAVSSNDSTSSGSAGGSSGDIEPTPPEEGTEIVLLIDRSSAMYGEEGDNGFTATSGGKNRIQVIQQAVVQCLNEGVFSPNDYIGVIFFGGKKNTPIEALNLTTVNNVFAIKNAIDMDITSITGNKNHLGNTEWRHALEAATKMLASSKAVGRDRIVMITDGAGDRVDGESSQLNGYPNGSWKVDAEKYTNQPIPAGVPQSCYTDYILRTYGITTSVINISCNLSPAKEFLQMMETTSDIDGKTHYYYVETKEQIIDAVTAELGSVSNNGGGSSKPTVPDGTSDQAKTMIIAINNIGEVTSVNFREKADIIKTCETEYNKLTAEQKAEVINYQDLVNARAKYDEFYASAVCVEFEQLVNSLPEANALKNADVPNVNKAWEVFNENSPLLEKGLADYAQLKAKLVACHERLLSCTVEKTYIAQDCNGNGVLEDSVTDKNGKVYSEINATKKRGRDFEPVTNFFGITDKIGGYAEYSTSHMYTDSNNPTPVKIFQYTDITTVTFTVPSQGKLTMYVRVGASRTYNVAQNGKTIFSKEAGDDAASCVFEIPVEAGEVTVSEINARGYLCAIKYSYVDIK